MQKYVRICRIIMPIAPRRYGQKARAQMSYLVRRVAVLPTYALFSLSHFSTCSRLKPMNSAIS